MSTNATQVRLDIHPDRLNWKPDPALAPLNAARTLGAALTDRARQEPDAVAYYLADKADSESRLTVGDLYQRASAAAATLSAAGLSRGGRACLCLDTSAGLLAALYGTALLGAVPIVTEPPLTAGRRRAWLDRLRHIAEMARPAVLVCDETLRQEAEAALAPLGVTVMCPPFQHPGLAPLVLDASLEEPAIIQFSSGTTSAAKGVVLSHRALRAAVAAIGQASPFHRGDLAVSWLPLHHDMGLVGSTLACIWHGIPTVLIRPLSFGMRPTVWLRQLHRYRGTLSPAPNFAYQLIVSRAREADLDGLDLSSWRTAFNGAEVVDAHTVREFTRILGPYGFREESMRPCYGMAELGLAASFSPAGTAPRIERLSRLALAEGGAVAPPVSERDAQEYVSSGYPAPGTRVVVADEEGGDLPEGRVGRVLLSSDSMMTGYLNAPSEAADGSRPGLLDTGDLGFMLGGELFVTGRAKDVIIIAGRNYHPQPFEIAAATVDGVRTGGTAAIGLPNADRGTEQLAIVVETRHHNNTARAQEVRRAVEQTVATSTGVSPSHVVIVKPGSLPRTSSGKTQRHLVSRLLATGGLSGELPGGSSAGQQPGGQEPPASPTASVS